MTRVACSLGTIAILTLGLGAALAAQPASSPTYFMPGVEQAPGGSCASTNFRLDAGFGAGVVPERTLSTSFRLDGGFNAVFDAPVSGSPWLTGVAAPYGPLLGGTNHTLFGTELALGTATNVTVDGAAASVLSRSIDRLQVTLPALSSPGWKEITATNTGGTARLRDAIGILPLVEKGWAIGGGLPFRVTYRGTQGDIFYLAVAKAKLPFAVPIPPYHHGLELNFGALVGLVGPFPVTAPSGVFHLDFPGIPLPRPLFVQLLALPTGNPGYGPGSFTNVIEL